MPSWGKIVTEIQNTKGGPSGETPPDVVRHKYMMALHALTGRNVIAYYSGFLQKPRIEGTEINDEDKHGFMECVGGLDRSQGLDLFLHTPGGNGAATKSLVKYLRQMFGADIRAVVPQIAMSAGTLIACACKEIVMGLHSNIGPIDAQVHGFPASAVLKEIETAYIQIQTDPNRHKVWHSILSKYTPGFIQLCQWGEENSRELATDFLKNGMFSDLIGTNQDQAISKVLAKLGDLSSNKSHDNHIHIDECEEMGLRLVKLEDKEHKGLQDAVLSVHHCFMFTVSNTPVFKIIENQVGRRFLKSQVQQSSMQFLMPMQTP